MVIKSIFSKSNRYLKSNHFSGGVWLFVLGTFFTASVPLASQENPYQRQDYRAGVEWIYRLHYYQKDQIGVRFAWQSLAGIEYGRVQLDETYPPDSIPDAHQMQQNLIIAMYHAGARFDNVVPATQALRDGRSRMRGQYLYQDYLWRYDTWDWKGYNLGIACTRRRDGRMRISYAMFYKK